MAILQYAKKYEVVDDYKIVLTYYRLAVSTIITNLIHCDDSIVKSLSSVVTSLSLKQMENHIHVVLSYTIIVDRLK